MILQKKSELLTPINNDIPTEEECERDSTYAASPKWVYNLLTGNSSENVKNKVISALKSNLFSGKPAPLVVQKILFGKKSRILFTNNLLIQWGETSSDNRKTYFINSFNNDNYSLIITTYNGNWTYVVEKHHSYFLLQHNYIVNFFAIGEAKS